MLHIFLLILPVFIIIAVGTLLKKTRLLNDNFVSTSNALIFNILLPVLLFFKISHSDPTQLLTISDITITLISVFTIFLLSFPVARIIKLPWQSTGTFGMNNFRTNFAYMGLPVCLYSYGEQGLAIGSIILAIAVPVVNIFSIVSLGITNKTSFQKKIFIKNTFFNPVILACLTGLVFSWLKVPIPDFINRSLATLSGITLPLALFSIGATIDFAKIKGSLRPICTSSVIKLFVLPFVAYLMLKGTHTPVNLPEKVLIIMLSGPSATINYVFASVMKGDENLANGTIIVTTVLSFFSFIFWLRFLETV